MGSKTFGLSEIPIHWVSIACCLFLFGLRIQVVAAPPPPSVASFSKVVGMVSQQVVTSREVHASQVVDRVILSDKAAVTGIDDPISRVLMEIAIALESKPFSISVPEEEVLSAEKKILSAIESAAWKTDWEKLDLSKKELLALLDTKLKAKKFVEFKIKASLLAVSDADALQYFVKNKKKFGDAPFAQFKETIKSVISQQQADDRMRDWFVVLQKKYKIRKVSTL